MKTEMGKIADLLNPEAICKSPCSNKLHILGKNLGVLAPVVCAVIFAIGWGTVCL